MFWGNLTYNQNICGWNNEEKGGFTLFERMHKSKWLLQGWLVFVTMCFLCIVIQALKFVNTPVSDTQEISFK